ncbi:lipopolysaccharide heptosyltransferase II [Dictyobacter arantiisoli]|uniref:lipopolysaccharide heptosyltransferase II n=1 Tax=Dictyobacter arantiisoli TaxID=2014874 RepID=A0A5A5T6R9_9CHLR|nr:lipopolysaccharide heptosyltransferase II [Dictyobacter arantiisoli]GCF07092.1 hypothetical protein KDI_06560 [Dictyobacter arantiisoli]
MGQAFQVDSKRDEYGYPLRPDSRRRMRNITVGLSKRVLLLAIYVLMSLIGTLLRGQKGAASRVPLTPEHFHPRRILVLRLDLIGDLVLSLPVVRLLKRTYPDAEIDLLALPSSAKVISTDPDVHALIPYDPNIWRRPKSLFQVRNWLAARSLYRQLHAQQYDLAVSVFGPWAAILAVLSGAQRRLGYEQESYPGLMTDTIPGQHWHPGDHIHEVDYCLQLVEAAGATVVPEDRIPALFVHPDVQHEVKLLLDQAGISPHKPLVACHVSSNNGQSKRWPIPYWAALIDQLLRENVASVVFTGAPADIPLIEAIIARMKMQAVNMAGKTSLAQLAALLQRADVLVTGDSGPMHIACAVDTAVIAIHGPTDPALSGPVSPKATILRDTIWCSPCYQAKGAPADCRFFTTQCMKNIRPERVFMEVQQKLQQAQRIDLDAQQASVPGGEVDGSHS